MVEKGNGIQILADVTKTETVPADLVSFEENNGYVIINFLQTFPNGLPNPNNDSVPERIARIASRVSISRDHFVRLIPIMQGIAKSTQGNMDKLNLETSKIMDKLNKMGD